FSSGIGGLAWSSWRRIWARTTASQARGAEGCGWCPEVHLGKQGVRRHQWPQGRQRICVAYDGLRFPGLDSRRRREGTPFYPCLPACWLRLPTCHIWSAFRDHVGSCSEERADGGCVSHVCLRA
ncbi:unnamed protein product, partial [Ectocarpus sp. 12 AP-2014]